MRKPLCVRALPLCLMSCRREGAVSVPRNMEMAHLIETLRRRHRGHRRLQVGRRPSLAAPARRRPSRRAVTPARLATPARAAPSCSPAGPFTSQPGARLGSRRRNGCSQWQRLGPAVTRHRSLARTLQRAPPLPWQDDASFRRLASCANARFGAHEHACGQGRGAVHPVHPL